MKVAIKAFVPEYVANIGDGMAPANDPMFKINPRFLEIIDWHDRSRNRYCCYL